MNIPILETAKVYRGKLDAVLLFEGNKLKLSEENRIDERLHLYKVETTDGKIFFYLNKPKEKLLKQVVRNGRSWETVQNWYYSRLKFEVGEMDCHSTGKTPTEDLTEIDYLETLLDTDY